MAKKARKGIQSFFDVDFSTGEDFEGEVFRTELVIVGSIFFDESYVGVLSFSTDCEGIFFLLTESIFELFPCGGGIVLTGGGISKVPSFIFSIGVA